VSEPSARFAARTLAVARMFSPEDRVGAAVHAVHSPRQQLEEAQAELDAHPTSSADGLCVSCKTLGPCPAHDEAAAVFRRHGRLPLRLPGATRPQLVAARVLRHAAPRSHPTRGATRPQLVAARVVAR